MKIEKHNVCKILYVYWIKLHKMINPNKKNDTSNNITSNQNNQLFAVLDKLKNRLPMFIISIYCTVTTMIYDDLTTNTFDTIFFKSYYVFLCILAIAWDLWHSVRAYNDSNICCLMIFCIISLSISFPLFIVATNIVSFGIPLKVFFNIDKNVTVLIYGMIFPFMYFMNVVENVYWKNVVDNWTKIEDADDDLDEGTPKSFASVTFDINHMPLDHADTNYDIGYGTINYHN